MCAEIPTSLTSSLYAPGLPALIPRSMHRLHEIAPAFRALVRVASAFNSADCIRIGESEVEMFVNGGVTECSPLCFAFDRPIYVYEQAHHVA
jgi:hypothetical protein